METLSQNKISDTIEKAVKTLNNWTYIYPLIDHARINDKKLKYFHPIMDVIEKEGCEIEAKLTKSLSCLISFCDNDCFLEVVDLDCTLTNYIFMAERLTESYGCCREDELKDLYTIKTDEDGCIYLSNV